MQLVAERKRFTDSATKRCVVRSREKAIYRQAIGGTALRSSLRRHPVSNFAVQLEPHAHAAKTSKVKPGAWLEPPAANVSARFTVYTAMREATVPALPIYCNLTFAFCRAVISPNCAGCSQSAVAPAFVSSSLVP